MKPSSQFPGEPAPEALRQSQVWDGQGQAHSLEELWHEGPVALILLRHFSCVGCHQNMRALVPRLHELAQLGVQSLAIGNGEARYIEGFVERLRLEDKAIAVYTDPSLSTHRAAGMRRTWWGSFGWPGVRDFLRAVGEGHWQTRFEGDAPQQAGALLLDETRRIRYHYQGQSVGDFAPTNALVQAAMALHVQRSTPRQ